MASEKANYYVSSLVRKLQGNSSSSVQKVLISLARATKKSENVVKFRLEGGIKILLQFIRTSNRKIVDMSVSVLANCALEKESRIEIIRLNGLAYLNTILCSLNETSILSRVTRAFANLSLDQSTAQQIVDLDVIPKLVHLLEETTDLHFQQNIIRALRIIGKIDDGKKEVVDCNGLGFIIELLRSENKNIKSSCLQSLQELSKTGSRMVAEQIQEHCAIETVIEMTKSEEADIRENAVLTLSHITRHASVRVSVGTVGGIEAFVNQIQNRVSQNLVLRSIEGVCMCCREAVNRNKVRSSGGLEVLMKILRCPEYSQAYDRILGAFVCFTYDELALNRLITNGIVPVLIFHLNQLLSQSAWKDAEDEDASTLRKAQSTAETCGKCLTISSDKTMVNSRKSPEICELVTKPVVETRFSDSRTEKTYESGTDSRFSTDVEQTNPLSPTSSLSPSCSPELRLSYVSPVNTSSVSDAAFSPMVYSPCGSDVEDDDDSAEGLFFEDKSNEEEVLLGSDASNAGASIEDSQIVVNVSVSGDCWTTTSRATMSCSRGTHADDQEASMHVRASESCLRPSSEVSTLCQATPLFPGASIADHLRMFLPKENLFSADQPSPRKPESPVNPKMRRVRRSSSQGTPNTSSVDSHSALNSPVNIHPSSPYSGELRGPEKKILFLLSRFAQMPNPSEELITTSCIQALLDYLSFSSDPDPRCARLLSRLTWNVNCFEALVLHMVPGSLYRQLSCGFRPGYHLENYDNSSKVKPESKVEETSAIHCGGSARIQNERHVKSEWQNDESLRGNSVAEKTVLEKDLPVDGVKFGAYNFSPSRTLETGRLLLSKMSTQAGTSFGEGQLAHLLLRGSQKQKRACAISLPYLCRVMRLKRKLLLEYNGILTILSALRNPEEDDDMVRAIESLTFLISNSSMRLPKKDLSELFIGKERFIKPTTLQRKRDSVSSNGRRRESTDELEIPVTKRKKTEQMSLTDEKDRKPVVSVETKQSNVLHFSEKIPKMGICYSEPVLVNTGCRYEIRGAPYDVVLKLDSGESIEAHRHVLSAVSDVFTAMLSSDYMEAKQPEVIVKDIDYFVLLFVVHYAYGCQWYTEQDSYCTSNGTSALCVVLEKCLQCNQLETNFYFLTDLLVCADRFLIDGLKSQCEQLITCCVNEDRVVDAYLCGSCYHAPVLRDFSLKYIFLGKLNLLCVYQCIKSLLESGERQSVLDDLKRIVLCCF